MSNYINPNEELINKIKSRQDELKEMTSSLIEEDEHKQHKANQEWFKQLNKNRANIKKTAVLNYG